ncbi:hypothetical protein PF010_g27716 [Phytophthora fragariae]|uniref:Aconitase/3-isopropylmalate dehydratase large subunit alpha/beta/alpha domain-containing protein n=1 Tax=Phytophthora fragariae TaxID=53985 RepID=A0A6G0JTN4_9STRA|nr:hypothetical protein PF010_g27716 [Phytophthora fragariae]KAE9172994.1 hypothetical protein PF004_g27111 [Phytophthora fragariae]
MADVKPLIALYPSPDNCVSVQEKFGIKLDGCFIGACTTTQKDLILVIIDRLKDLGLIRIYEETGFTIGVPSCSFCVGIGADVTGEGEVWLSSQNRNFRNRMGQGSIGNLSSAAVVATSSFDMEVVDPLPYPDNISKDDFDSYRN